MNVFSLLFSLAAMMAVTANAQETAYLRTSNNLLTHEFGPRSISDTAASRPELKTAISIMMNAGLGGRLAGDTKYTIFAPSNDAIASLTSQPNPADLPEIFKYHVVQGVYASKDLTPGLCLVTLQGNELVIPAAGHVNDAKIVTEDIMATNGVIHVIDAVLSPDTTSSV